MDLGPGTGTGTGTETGTGTGTGTLMSERYGECLHCRGSGERLIPVYEELLFQEEGKLQKIVDIERRECGTCGGTGQGGDVTQLIDKERKMEKINESVNEIRTDWRDR